MRVARGGLPGFGSMAPGGDMDDQRCWLHRDDLLEAIRAVGFTDIRTSHDVPNHAYGPALSIFARK